MAAKDWDQKQPKFVTPGASVPRIIWAPEASSQSFKANAPVFLSSNAVTVIPTGQVDISAEPILGLSQKAATGTTSTSLPILVPSAETEITVLVTSGGTAETANTTCVIGGKYGAYITSDYQLVLDSADTTEDAFQVIKFVTDVNGDVTQWAVCKPLAGAWAMVPEGAKVSVG